MAASSRLGSRRTSGSRCRAGRCRSTVASSRRTFWRSCVGSTETAGASRLRPSRRLERIPPYLFAELERKIRAKRAAGVDVISLGIGDPDTPTYGPIVEAAQRAVADPGTHRYPTNRGRQEFRAAVAAFYARR